MVLSNVFHAAGFCVYLINPTKIKSVSGAVLDFDTVKVSYVPKVKSMAKLLCNDLGLSNLAKSVQKSEGVSLDVFFAAKPHKEGTPALQSYRTRKRLLAGAGWLSS